MIARLQRFYGADTPLRWRRVQQGLIDELLYWLPIIEREEMLQHAEAIVIAAKGEEAILEERKHLREMIEKRVPRSALQTNRQVLQEEETNEPLFANFEEFELYAQATFAGVGE